MLATYSGDLSRPSILSEATPAQTISGSGATLLPGLIDTHTHLEPFVRRGDLPARARRIAAFLKSNDRRIRETALEARAMDHLEAAGRTGALAAMRAAEDVLDEVVSQPQFVNQRARIFELGAAMALEVGKNRMESLGDVQETADLIYYSCYQMEKNNGYIVEMGKDPLVGYEASNVSVLRPYGVWLVVSPFNFPLNLVAHKVLRRLSSSRRDWATIERGSAWLGVRGKASLPPCLVRTWSTVRR